MNVIGTAYELSEKIIKEFNKSAKEHEVDNLVEQKVSFFSGGENSDGVVEINICFTYTLGDKENPPYWRADDDAKEKINEKVMPCIRGLRGFIIGIIESFVDYEKFNFKLEDPTKYGMVWNSVFIKGKGIKK